MARSPSLAVAPGGGGVGPLSFHGVGRQAVESGFMNETPVFESEVQSCVVPCGAIRIPVVTEALGDFALVG